jgi:tRNA/rRNA methyltransferase
MGVAQRVFLLLLIHCLLDPHVAFMRRYSDVRVRSFNLLNGFKGYTHTTGKEGAFQKAKDQEIQMPAIILVNPYLDQNVGSVSRAMLNYGLTDLRVVDPNCNITSDDALALASGSAELLQNAKVFSTLEEATADLQRVYATTVRLRGMNQRLYTPGAAAKEAIKPDNSVKAGILFGRERNGLSNDEVAYADSIISIPTFKHFPSLNLAQAVNIVGYELFTKKLEAEAAMPPDVWLHPKDFDRLARKNEVDSFLTRLENMLLDRDYVVNTQTFRNIRSIFYRVSTTRSEMDLLHGVITCLSNSKGERGSKSIPEVPSVIPDESNPAEKSPKLPQEI